MTRPDPDPDVPRPTGLRLHDLAGLVVGYSLAAMLVRSFRPFGGGETAAYGVVLVLFYLWLGLAMSGPVVMLLDRRGPADRGEARSTDAVSRYTGDETAWVLIGGYFIALTLFVIPARHRETPWSLILLIQAVAAIAVLIWRPIDRRSRAKRPPSPPRWTRRAATALLMTWPVAWVLLVLLLK